MLDGKKYMKELVGLTIAPLICPHCNSQTLSAHGKSSFCNFCEQYIDTSISGESAAAAAFAPIQSAMVQGRLEDALASAEQLMKGSKDPAQLYLLGQFYLYLSVIKYYQRDYALKGFMEENAQNIRSSMDLTSRWKECYFKTIRLVADELKGNVQVDAELVFMKFMSEIRLQRYADAGDTLRVIQRLDKRGVLSTYALLVFSVEKGTKQAQPSLVEVLATQEINSFYYLAKNLAKQKQLEDARMLLQRLNERTRLFLAQDLLYKVEAAQEASRM